jgi:FSR family fosmidomycin resistance protein-like MFS transporter
VLFLLIEFLDEWIYGAQNAALPAIRSTLRLPYGQIGLLVGLPGLLSVGVEPLVMLLGDTRWRRRLILLGGAAVAACLLAAGLADGFPVLLAAVTLGYPASGAFVSLSQAALIEAERGREAQAMARWTLAGSLGALIGPLFLSGVLLLGRTWRSAYLLLAALTIGVTAFAARRLPAVPDAGPAIPLTSLLGGNLRAALHRTGLVRWLLLLQLSDLMLDVWIGYAALYFVDVVGLTAAQAGLVLGAMMAAGLVGDALAVPLLQRLPARRLVRVTSAAAVVLYPMWLLLPAPPAKVVLALALSMVTLGWYAVLQAEAFACAPGRSGTVMALTSVSGLIGAGIAAGVGAIAGLAGLSTAMWVLIAGPLALLIGIPASGAGVTIPPAAAQAGGTPPNR